MVKEQILKDPLGDLDLTGLYFIGEVDGQIRRGRIVSRLSEGYWYVESCDLHGNWAKKEIFFLWRMSDFDFQPKDEAKRQPWVKQFEENIHKSGLLDKLDQK
jgi:hypothetical protein